MADNFATAPTGLNSPPDSDFDITPDDDNDLPLATRGIYVGVTGDLTVTLVNSSSSRTYKNLAAGVIHPIRARRVHDTGTTVTFIIGLN